MFRMRETKDLHVEQMFFDQRHEGHVKPKSARKRSSSLLRILDEAMVSEREHQNQEKWQRADKRHRERFQKNATAKPTAPSPVFFFSCGR